MNKNNYIDICVKINSEIQKMANIWAFWLSQLGIIKCRKVKTNSIFVNLFITIDCNV